MDKMTAWVALSENNLANRLLMRYFFVLFLLSLDSLVSFISEVSSSNYSYSLFSCSMANFLTQPSVSLGKLT